MSLILSGRYVLKDPRGSNYNTVYWFDRLEREYMSYENICKRYGVESMSDEELIKRDYVKIDRVDIVDIYRDYAARHMTDELAAKLEGKEGKEYITAFAWHFDNTDEEWDFNVFLMAATAYLELKWVYENDITNCAMFSELRKKTRHSEDNMYGTKIAHEWTEIFRREKEDEEEYKKTLPRRTDY